MANEKWTVKRKSRAFVDWRIVYEGREEVARRKYERIDLNLRQGAVALYDPEGNEVAKASGPMVRTRW